MDTTRRRFVKQSLVGAVTAGGVSSSHYTNAENTPNTITDMTPDELRSQLVTCLGGPWPKPGPLKVEHRETIQKDGYRIESLSYEVESDDRVPAMLLIPDGVSEKKPAPSICH